MVERRVLLTFEKMDVAWYESQEINHAIKDIALREGTALACSS